MSSHSLALHHETPARSSLGMALVCYVAWGVFPLYWKLLGHLSAFETLAHRFIWSFVFYLVIYVVMHHVLRQDKMVLVRASMRDWILSGLASAMLAINWGVFIYAINTGRVLESSLAYFINPLFNVAVGVLFFHETFPKLMKLACGLACVGVLLKAALGHDFPWISLALALSFCTYGIIKKCTRIHATQFSLMEASTALIPSIALAVWIRGEATIDLSAHDWCLLTSAGIVTGIPLFLFAMAAQKLPYSLMGMLQFIVPTLQFIIGIVVYHETLSLPSATAFVLIWSGVGCYIYDRLQHFLRQD